MTKKILERLEAGSENFPVIDENPKQLLNDAYHALLSKSEDIQELSRLIAAASEHATWIANVNKNEEKFDASVEEQPSQENPTEPPSELLKIAAGTIAKQEVIIDNLSILMRRMLLERQVDRQAMKFLKDNNLMGNPLRS